MKNITFIRQITEWPCLLLVLLLFQFQVQAQSVPVFANSIASQDEVDFAANAVDTDLTTRARIRANSGLALGIGAYSGHLEIQFPTTLPANTTSFVKIQTDEEILPSLLGGSLGNLLAGVTGVLLIGNQEITVHAKNGNIPVLIADSQVSSDFATPRMRIVVNAAQEYFIALTPSQPYNRIRLTNRLGTLVGLNNTKRLDVYGAFYIGTPDTCGGATFTSYDGSGLTLDLLMLGNAGVNNAHRVLDANTNTFSRLSLGIVGAAASVEQTVYFDGTSAATDQFFVRLRIDPALLGLGVANNIQIVAHNGPSHVQTSNLGTLLNVDLLTLLQGDNIVSIPFSPGGPANRITVRYNALLNVQLTQSLDLYDIVRAPADPVITDAFTQNAIICSNATASLIVETVAGTELNWYASASGGIPLATTASGEPFVTDVLTSSRAFYVAAKRIGCPEESSRIRIDVTVTTLPVAADISIASPVDACNGSVILSPLSSIGGATFRYYKDQNKAVEITTGFSGDAGVTYIKDNTTGQLSIAGLNATDSPYTYYISLTNNGCENAANTLKPVIVHFSSSLNLAVLADISRCGSVNLKDAIVNFDNSPDIEYHFFDSDSTPITAETAENIQTSGTYYIQAVSIAGSCSSTLKQVNVTVDPQPTLAVANTNVVANLGASVTLDATSDGTVTWYDANGNMLPSNTYGPFTAVGFYSFTAVAAIGNCSATGNVNVVVIDAANCPALTERVYADSQSWGSILTGGVFDASDAADHNPQTHSTIVTGIGLLGLGTTWQTLQWDNTIAAGTPVTIKLGSEYSGLIVAGAYSVVGTKRNGSGIAEDIGFIQPVSGSIADLLPGENSFEITFVPSDFTGPKPFDGVRIIVVSVASIAQNVKVYEAYYDRQVTQAICGSGDIEDVFSGVVDLGLGIATATVSVIDPWNAVDSSAMSYASMYSGAGILAAADLTVSFRTPTLTTDRLDVLLSRPATILDLGLLSGLTIQLYLGSAAVSPVYDVNASVLSLALVDGGASARLTLQSQTVVYDRIKIRFGGTASVLDHLRVHDIRRHANTSVIGADLTNTIEACVGQTITLAGAADDCTTYIWYDAATGGNVISTGSSFTVPATLTAGTYAYYIQPVRFGCETFERRLATVILGQTAPPTAITGISLNGGSVTTFCDQTNITLVATLDSATTITNPVFHWYDNTGLTIAETTNTLALAGLAAGTYTYSVGVSSDEYCETAPADRATVTFTILPFSQPSDIVADDTLVCQGIDAVILPASLLSNPEFSWYFTNSSTQPIASGSTVGGVTFTIAPDGQLTLSGLILANSPYTYYVGLVSDATCLNQDGNFKAVTITVNDSGTPTTNDETQEFCQATNPTLANIQVNEVNVVWYDAATDGSLLPNDTALVNGNIYYAGFAPSAGCGSALRLAITVDVNDAPTPTTADASQEFCAIGNPTVAQIQVNVAGVTWYLAPAGGTALSSTDLLIHGTTYYGSLTIAGCESSVRLAVSVTINDADTPATTSTTQDFCLVDNPIVADIQVNEPGVVWYDAATNGNIVPLTNALVHGTNYYGSITDPDNGCQSSLRLVVTVTVNNPETPTTNTPNPTFCAIDSPTIADIQINESPIVWYNAATAGNVLPATAMLVDGGVYHAALFDAATGCESATRLSVTVTINDAPTPTSQDDTQEFCALSNPTVANIQVNESSVVFYNAPSGGTQLATSDLLIDDAVYYAAQIVNGCESSVRLALTVNILDGGTPTTNDNTQDFCVIDAPTLANIQTNESNIIWFDAASGGNTLPMTTLLADGATYYASFDGIQACNSVVRLAVTVSVNDATTPTTTDSTQEFCQSVSLTLADIQVNETGVIWYNSASGGTAIPGNTALTAGIYYAALVDASSGCESATRLAVTIGFTGSTTATISSGNNVPCVFDTVTYTTETGMSNYSWTVTGGSIIDGGQGTDNFVTVNWPEIAVGVITVSYTNSCNATSTGTLNAPVSTCSDITITKTVSNPTPMVSESVVFAVTVTNAGHGQFHNVVVQDVVPNGYELLSMTATAGTYNNGMWTIDIMMPNQVAVMTMTVKVLGVGNYLNTASIIVSDPVDSDVSNNSAEASIDPVCLTVYNEFSPNNDGANDLFMIDCIESFPDNKLEVYNRYGSLVYTKTKYLNDWDGTANVSGVISKDDKLPAGTYYYVLDIGAEGVKTGWLAITR